MTTDKLQEAMSAGFELTAAVLGSLTGDPNDPRLVCLRMLVINLRPNVIIGPLKCSDCSMLRRDMVWHHTENMNICPRCKAPLK